MVLLFAMIFLYFYTKFIVWLCTDREPPENERYKRILHEKSVSNNTCCCREIVTWNDIYEDIEDGN
jgi:hypothetical protein